MNAPNIHAIKHWKAPGFIAVLCCGIALFGDAGREVFAYQNDLIGSKQLWRGVSGHFSHLGWPHLFLNIFGLCGVWSLYAKTHSPLKWGLIFLTCCIAISAGFYIFDRDVQSYVGLSGVLHGLLAAGAIGSLFQAIKLGRGWPLEDVFVFTALWLKVAYEQMAGPVPMTESMSGGAVVINAHLYGAIVGTAIGCMCAAFIRTNKTSKSLF